MSAEVYSQRRDAVRGRALLAAALLLVAAAILASMMVRSRSGQVLQTRLHPTGWEMSFQPPRGFILMESNLGPGNTDRHYLGRTRQGQPIQLLLARVPEREETPESVASSIRADIALQQFQDKSLPGPSTEMSMLGPVKGVQIKDLSGSVVVRAARVSPSTIFLATMFVIDGALDESAYGTFEAVCESFQRE